MVLGLALALALGASPVAAKKKASVEVPPKPRILSASIEAKSGAKLAGEVTFSITAKDVTVKVAVTGAPPGEHAVHLHEKGDCSAPDGNSAGGHWNPGNDPHGRWTKEHHHLGDIGNMTVGDDGKGEVTLTTDKWTVGSGHPNDVVGKSVIVHEKRDDFTSQPSGNAGGRIGCAVLGQGPGAG